MDKTKLRLVIDNTGKERKVAQVEDKPEVVDNKSEWNSPSFSERSKSIWIWVGISIMLTIIINVIF